MHRKVRIKPTAQTGEMLFIADIALDKWPDFMS